MNARSVFALPAVLRFLAVAAAALVLGGPAGAQSLADFERIDANKDGAVSLEEFEAARRRDFDQLDGSRDGFLSRDEFIRLRGADPTMTRLRERRFEQIDANRDGRISRDEYLAHGRRQFAFLDRDRDRRITRAEFEAALAGRATPPPAERPPARPPGLRRPPPVSDERELQAAFERIDRNRDGFLTLAELDAARLEAFQQADANGDNRLSRDEIVAARGAAAAARFDELDGDKDGYISRREYLEAGRAMFRSADTNGDNRLSFDEFRASRGAR